MASPADVARVTRVPLTVDRRIVYSTSSVPKKK